MALPQFPDPMMQTLSSCSDDVWGLTAAAAEASMGFSNDILVDVVEVGDDEDGLEKRRCEGDLLVQIGSESTAVVVVVDKIILASSAAILHQEEERRMVLWLMSGRRWSANTRTRSRCTRETRDRIRNSFRVFFFGERHDGCGE